VLDDFNATFESGKLTAIVGPSGSGKSTIVGLIERWYQLSMDSNLNNEESCSANEKEKSTDAEKVPIALSGTIRIGSHNIEDLDLKWWRSQIGLVQQEPFIFNDTIYNNVAHGLVGSKFEHQSEEMKRRLVEEACKEAFADEFISKLPMVRHYDIFHEFSFTTLRFPTKSPVRRLLDRSINYRTIRACCLAHLARDLS
jgi:ABC-type multidrug transport system fused ATPase/permease subunit